MKSSSKIGALVIVSVVTFGLAEVVTRTRGETIISPHLASHLYGGDQKVTYPGKCCATDNNCTLVAVGACSSQTTEADCKKDFEDENVSGANLLGCVDPTTPDTDLQCVETIPKQDCYIKYGCTWDDQANPKCSKGAETERDQAPKKCTYNKSSPCP